MSVFDMFPTPFSRLALPLHDWDDNTAQENSKVATRGVFPSNFFQGPRIDIHELPEAYAVTAELAGANKQDIKVSIDGATRKLTLSGEIRSEYTNAPPSATTAGSEGDKNKQGTETAAAQGKAQKAYHDHHGPRPLITERVFGSFSRSFILPKDADVDAQDLKGRFDNGILKLTIPKKEPAKRQVRNVTIETVSE